ncbi:MAG: FeoB-associated Cys-rich membrane protein [Lachnospiraceae bacterium]|nr:FeoB-associated Cys-rich membrane protein [Lachnospiraceae bacterium]
MNIIEWLAQNAGTLIVGAILILLVFFAIRNIVKNRKNGGCGCGCSGCGSSKSGGSCPGCGK